ncbi:hypothetical protein, partial [Pseudoalteromonas sp. MER144-MNA-CIBAN-0113]|uniref:hypothetical protein n=1 Tax=Pseudoalteromonas sp. MER144-MNA-CIBAN-0113 TaxID=3140429 RepID=UPI0033224F3D
LRSYLSNARLQIGEIKPRSFFSSIEKLQTEINNAKECGFNETLQLDNIDTKIDDFTSAYEVYLEGYTPESASKMFMQSIKIEALLD